MKKFNILILAAGRGSRLGKKTTKEPKPLVKFKGKRILDYQIEVYKKFPTYKIYMVLGYKAGKIKNHLRNKKINYFMNRKFKSTNMFYSFLTAKSLLSQKRDLVVAYGDIIFKPKIFKKLIQNNSNLAVCIDQNYLPYWKKRMKNPLKDLETMVIKKNLIVNLGKQASTFREIQGQYIGLVKFSSKIFSKILKIIDDFKMKNKNYRNLYFTDFIQLLIDKQIKVRPVKIKGDWQEFDNPRDLKIDNLKV